jgi:Na+-transporting methylmalonyl-CoA/oxaloacetate decarboxylase beta subunit
MTFSNKKLTVIAIAGIILTLLLLLALALRMVLPTSVGIIGGADGPTTIFISSGASILPYILLPIFILAAIIPGVVIFVRKRKQRK